MKRIFAAALAALALTLGCATGPKPLSREVHITIAHTNDMHSRAVESKTELGYARIAGLVGELRAANPNTLLIDAGDVFHGLPFANLERGASIVRLMNAAGYSYLTTGNHDYNYGPVRLVELELQGKALLLAANVYRNGARLFRPYDVRVIEGVRVAFFGLATPETAYKADPKLVAGIVFADPVAETRKVMAELKGRYDLLVCISHLGIDRSSDITSDKLAASVPGIDLIIDGHSHSSLAQTKAVNKTGTLIVSADSYGISLGVVDLRVGPNRKLASASARTISLKDRPDAPSDPRVKAEVDAIVAAQAPLLAQKVGSTHVNLEGKREIVRTSESNLGKLIASSMLYATGADVAFINGGGIRDSIPAGDITKKHIFTVLPFGNYIQTGVFKGSEFKAIIEHGVGKLPAADGRFPHFVGLSYVLDAANPAGQRVSDIRIGGKPVEPGKDYVLAAVNFEFNGGDEYTMLGGRPLKDYPSDAEVFMAYVMKLGAISAENIEYRK